jgi:activator of Hsp90 ATPase-like protein
MGSRDSVHGIEIHAEPKSVFETAATRSGLASFWTPSVEGDDSVGGELRFGFTGAPVPLRMGVTRLDAPSEIRWDCPGDFPFWAGTTVAWAIEASEHGSRVLFRHAGFPDEQPDYEFGSVNLTWGLVVARLKEVVESGGAANPALG